MARGSQNKRHWNAKQIQTKWKYRFNIVYHMNHLACHTRWQTWLQLLARSNQHSKIAIKALGIFFVHIKKFKSENREKPPLKTFSKYEKKLKKNETF